MFLNCNDFLPFESKIVFIRLGSDSGFVSLLVSDQSDLRLSSDVKTFYKRVQVVEELCHLWSPQYRKHRIPRQQPIADSRRWSGTISSRPLCFLGCKHFTSGQSNLLKVVLLVEIPKIIPIAPSDRLKSDSGRLVIAQIDYWSSLCSLRQNLLIAGNGWSER